MNKQTVCFDNKARKEFEDSPKEIQRAFLAVISNIQEYGYIFEPYGKKISDKLFEIRVSQNGKRYRAIYFYNNDNVIIIILVFKKTSQKIPKNLIDLANKRYNTYFN